MRGQALNEYFEPERGQNKKRPKGQNNRGKKHGGQK